LMLLLEILLHLAVSMSFAAVPQQQEWSWIVAT